MTNELTQNINILVWMRHILQCSVRQFCMHSVPSEGIFLSKYLKSNYFRQYAAEIEYYKLNINLPKNNINMK